MKKCDLTLLTVTLMPNPKCNKCPFIQNDLKKGIFIMDFTSSNEFTALKLLLP